MRVSHTNMEQNQAKRTFKQTSKDIKEEQQEHKNKTGNFAEQNIIQNINIIRNTIKAKKEIRQKKIE